MIQKVEIADIDFVVDPRPLTREDVLVISEYIKNDKLSRITSGGITGKTIRLKKSKIAEKI